jgi:hypothetical protein
MIQAAPRTREHFDQWFPISVEIAEDGPRVRWYHRSDITFDDAYFGDTVARAAKRPFNLVFGRITSIEEAGEIADRTVSLPPCGFLFHMSRCGSTLVSKSFALRADTLVLAEAGPINDVLSLPNADISEETRVLLLRLIVALLARPQRPDQVRSFIKLDAWHARYLPLLAKAFPDVPFAFLHRDPLEVLVSHMGAMSYMMSAANAPVALGISVTDAMKIPRVEYCARVLADILESVKKTDLPAARLIDYRELPEAIWGRIAQTFGVSFSDAEIARVRANAGFHAKRPQLAFTTDSLEKQAQVTEELRAAAAAARLEEHYARFRSAQAASPMPTSVHMKTPTLG